MSLFSRLRARLSARLSGRRGGLYLLALAAVTAGIVLIVVAVNAQVSAPSVPTSAHGTLKITQPLASGPTARARADAQANADIVKPLPPSRPVHVSIPAIGVSSPMFTIGKNPDGTLGVPQPGPHLNQVAWYRNSPTPGQPGPSVILGHVDTVQGASVFLDLGNVRPGDKIHITRKDGLRLTFTVNAVRDYKKAHFPTRLVYGSDTSTPTLRVITCSDWDPAIDHHIGNEVVFAHLTHSRAEETP